MLQASVAAGQLSDLGGVAFPLSSQLCAALVQHVQQRMIIPSLDCSPTTVSVPMVSHIHLTGIVSVCPLAAANKFTDAWGRLVDFDYIWLVFA